MDLFHQKISQEDLDTIVEKEVISPLDDVLNAGDATNGARHVHAILKHQPELILSNRARQYLSVLGERV